jgi:hypothetical protein
MLSCGEDRFADPEALQLNACCPRGSVADAMTTGIARAASAADQRSRPATLPS